MRLMRLISGLFLGIFREDLLLISFILTITGLLGMVLFAITWLLRPKVNFFSWKIV